MNKQWVHGIVGVAAGVIVTLGVLTAIGIIVPFDNHDEPIIIEEGSVKVDFDYNRDTSTDSGTLLADRQVVSRSGAHGIVRVRAFINGTEFQCRGGKCLVGGNVLHISTNARPIGFYWNRTGHGIAMSSWEQRFQEVSGSSGKFVSQDASAKIQSISFQHQGTWATFPLRTSPNDRITLQLCSLDDADHCDKYKTP